MQETENKIIHSSFWANLFKVTPEKDELIHILKEMPPFVELSRSDLNKLVEIIHHRDYVKGEYIFYQGDPGIGLYIIRSGEVEIEYKTELNHRYTFATFGKADFFGELALLDGAKRSASAVAKTDCKLAIVFKPDLDEFVYKNPRAGTTVISGLSKIIITRLRNLNFEYLKLQESITNKEHKNEYTGKENISPD